MPYLLLLLLLMLLDLILSITPIEAASDTTGASHIIQNASRPPQAWRRAPAHVAKQSVSISAASLD